MEKQWVNEKQVSKITARALSTLRNDRALGRGIPYYKMRRSVRYLLSDVFNFMEQRKVSTEG